MTRESMSCFAIAPLGLCPVSVGGLQVTAQITADALLVLLKAPGLMIRQPLEKARNALARCDYLAAGRPYRSLFSQPQPGVQLRRGAAGRHIAKQAFCAALEEKLQAVTADPLAAWAPLVSAAWQAFSSDAGYAAQLASAGAAARPRLAASIAA